MKFPFLCVLPVVVGCCGCGKVETAGQRPAEQVAAAAPERVSLAGASRGQRQEWRLRETARHLKEGVTILRSLQQGKGLVLKDGGQADLVPLEEKLSQLESVLGDSTKGSAAGMASSLLDELLEFERKLVWAVDSVERKALAQALVEATDAYESTDAPGASGMQDRQPEKSW